MKLFELSPNATMRELIYKLNQASEAYYNGREIMTNYEYDKLLAELQTLEKSTGIILPNSPSVKVGYPVKVDKLQKVKHEFPALSLDKTKDIEKVISTFTVTGQPWEEVVVMWKLDGSTVQLTYDQGKLLLAATRGDGYIGQNITHNVPYIEGIPLEVEYNGRFTVRGEAVISYEDFKSINEKLPDDEKFKNPRNLAAASITMLDPDDMKDRHVQFKAFELVDHPNLSDFNFWNRLLFCSTQNFGVVPHTLDSVNSEDELYQFREDLETSHPSQCEYYLPVDGLVVAYNDTSYTDGLEGTEHHPHVLKGYAFKWEDESAKTILRDIEWSPSRTGLLNPVAIFDSVELEGTTVSRASLHNFSIMKKFHIHIGDELEVIKANKIIPTVIANCSDSAEYTDCTFDEFSVVCPVCGSKGHIHTSKDMVQTVYCENSECPAKLIYKFEHFCERTSMNIEGLSEATIEKFVNLGFLKTFSDIYTLNYYENEIKHLDGFGEQSWTNLWEAIQASRNTTFVRFVVAIGIPNIGLSQAKALSEYFNQDIKKFLSSTYLDFSVIDGIGQIVSNHILTWLHNETAQQEIQSVLSFLNFSVEPSKKSDTLSGKVFVITGKLQQFKNRKALEASIESNGGKISSSVSSNTSYLINNDLKSTSSKNAKAKKLNIPIISESEYLKMLKG